MTTIDITAIILTMIGMVSGWVSFYLDRHKHRQEVQSMKRDNRQKDMNLSKDYVTEWRNLIAEPLQREVGELRKEVKELRDAIQRIDRCPHRDICPVYDGMRK